MTLVLALRGAVAIAIVALLAGGLPRVVAIGVAVLMGAWAGGMAGATEGNGWGDGLVLVAVREVVVGATMGIAAAVPLVVAATAGRLVDAAGNGRGSYAALFSILGAAVFVGIDGHVAVVAAVGESFRAVPVSGGAGVREAIGGLIGSAVRLSIPWLVTAAVVELAVGIGMRVAGRAAIQAPVGAVVPAALVMMTATLVATLAVGIAALIR